MQLDYSIIKSNRKTLALNINALGEIIVRAPKRCTNLEIVTFVKQNIEWINSKIALYHNTVPDIEALKSLKYIYLLGKKYEIRFTPSSNSRKKVCLNENEGYLQVIKSDKDIQNIIRFLKKYATDYFNKYCKINYEKISKLNNLSVYTDIKIINSKAKWGACDNKRILYFNWRAIMLNSDAIDYLILHELAHLSFMNHSKQYWQLVSSYLDTAINKKTTYKIYRKLLKEKNYYILLYR